MLGGAVDVCAVELPFEKIEVKLGLRVEVVDRGGEPSEGRSNRPNGEECPGPASEDGDVGACFDVAEDPPPAAATCDDSLSRNSIHRFEKDCREAAGVSRQCEGVMFEGREGTDFVLDSIVDRLRFSTSGVPFRAPSGTASDHAGSRQPARAPLQSNLLSLIVRPAEDRGDELQHLEAFRVATRRVEKRDEHVRDESAARCQANT